MESSGGIGGGFVESRRGVSSALAVTLLLGFSLVIVGSVVLLGSAAISDLESQAELEQAESAFQQFDSSSSQVALGDSSVHTTDLGMSEHSGTVRIEPTGRIKVTADDGTVYVDQKLGTIYYESDRGVVAYQGGGVWRGTEKDTRMVSPPEFHYRDGTLTLPVTVINPTETGDGNRLTITENGKRTGIGPGVVERQIVTVEITSPYYKGWAEYFETRIDGANVEVDEGANKVEVELARLEPTGDFENGLVAAGDIDIHTSGNVHATIESSGTVSGGGSISCDGGSGSDCYTENSDPGLEPLDAAIERMVENAEDNHPDAGISGSTTLSAGSYYSDGFELDGSILELDISSGNVTLFVDGNIGLDNGKIIVTGASSSENYYARIYTLGDFAMAKGNSEVSVNTDNATRFQMYGTSDMHFAIGQSNGPGFTAAVYAPRETSADGSNEAVGEYGLTSATSSCNSNADVCVGGGSGSVNGAIIGGPMDIGQSTDFQYDDDLAALSPTLPSGTALPPSITHLHVSVNRIDVAGAQEAEGSLSLPSPRVFADLEITERAGGDEYHFSATGTTGTSEVDEYRWDYDDDGTDDRTTTNPETTFQCQSAGGPLDCTSLPDKGKVTAVDTSGPNDDVIAEYPTSGGGAGGDPPSIDSFSVTDESKCAGGGCNGQNYAEFEVAWSVTDDDGDLDDVTAEVKKSGSSRESYSAYSATEIYHEEDAYSDGYTIRVIAEDDEGHVVCEKITDNSANEDDSDQSRSSC